MKKKKNEEEDEEPKLPLARWTEIAPPASLATKTGTQRFMVTIKLPEKSLKTASSFVTEMNDALKLKIAKTRGCTLKAEFVLVDAERTRLQRATASFAMFSEGQMCLQFLAELGLKVNPISAELEDFGTKQYDPWHESVSGAWWPWFATWRNPAPEMPMPKVASRLDVTEGSKYAQGASGKLGKAEDVEREEPPREEPPHEEPEEVVKPRKKKRRKEESPEEET